MLLTMEKLECGVSVDTLIDAGDELIPATDIMMANDGMYVRAYNTPVYCLRIAVCNDPDEKYKTGYRIKTRDGIVTIAKDQKVLIRTAIDKQCWKTGEEIFKAHEEGDRMSNSLSSPIMEVEKVYDISFCNIQVEETHNFIAGGFVCECSD